MSDQNPRDEPGWKKRKKNLVNINFLANLLDNVYI